MARTRVRPDQTTAGGRRTKGTSPREKTTDPKAVERAKAILLSEIDFVHSSAFEDAQTVAAILSDPIADPATGRRAKRPSGLPSYLASLYEVPLLTAEQEVALFRKMNGLKYRANQIRSQLDPRRPDPALMDEFDLLLAAEQEVRNRIARCNLRLVVSIARKFADRDNPFDDFVSDGNLALLQAIAKFDYGRGFRFSTYATHAIRRAFYRQIQQKRRRKGRVQAGSNVVVEAIDAHEPRPVDEGQYRRFRQLLERMPERLDDRERAILAARFGLDGEAGDDKAATLQRVAKRLGICKERVRQLQNRAVEKLRELARELGVEAPVMGV